MTARRASWPEVSVACVWLPQFPLRVEMLRHPAWDGLPLVQSGGPGERKVVQLCSPEAERAGIHPGLPLREVISLCREAIILEPDPVHTARVREEILRGLCRLSPSVEAREEELFLDLRGLEGLYRDDLDGLEEAIRRAVSPLLQPRLGFAGGKFTAAVAAREAPPFGRRVVSAPHARAFLAPLSIGHLPLPPQLGQRLDLLGLCTIADLTALPFPAVQAQFGPPGARAWRLAHGQDDEAIIPHRFDPPLGISFRAEDPLGSSEAVTAVLLQLLKQAFGRPNLTGRSVRQVRLRALLSSDTSWERLVTFKEPVSSVEGARLGLESRLGLANFLPSAPVEELSLELLGLTGEVARQPSLFLTRARQEGAIAEAVRQLCARYGYSPVYRIMELEPWSRIPERRWALIPYDP